MHFRKLLSQVIATLMLAAWIALGCGGTQEGSSMEHRSTNAVLGVPAAPSISQEAEEKLKKCVRGHARELKAFSHEAHFMIGMTDEGVASDVDVEKSSLTSHELESCMADAFVGMSIPLSAMLAPSSRPISGGERSPESRGQVAIVQVLGGVALLPIMVVAAGATVAVYVTATTIEAVKRRRRVDRQCDPPYHECFANQDQPDWNIDYFGRKKDCLSCLFECRRDNGNWPDYKCPRLGYRPN